MAEHAHPTPYVRRREPTLLFVVVFVFVSVGVHLVAFQGLRAYAAANARQVKMNQPVELVMVEVEPPKPPPPEPEKPPEPPAPKPKPPPIKVAVTKEKPPPPEENAPPPPNEEAPPEEAPAKPVPLVVGISMSSTTSSGGFAAPVGNTAYGKVADKAEDPSQVKNYRAPKYVPIYQVDTEPSVAAEVKIPYPDEARRASIEGQVVLSIHIDETGTVTSVKVLSGPGYGLEEAAVAALKRFKWKPATRGGEPVATEIKYTYTFLLD